MSIVRFGNGTDCMNIVASETLKVLIVTQYFWPENMRINDLVRDLIDKGHEVTVLTGIPNYPEGHVFGAYRANPGEYSNYYGARVVRVPMFARGKSSIRLILNYATFFLSASTIGAFKLRSMRFGNVFVYAVSPIMAAIPAIVIGKLKRAPVFVWVLDLWPETLRAVGVLQQPRLLKLVGKMVSWIYNRTDYLLLQSHGFAADVRKYCTRPIDAKRLRYFPSWAEDDFSIPSPPSALVGNDSSAFTVVFAGNIGEAQDFPAIVDTAQRLLNVVNVRWLIVGDGRMSEWLAANVKSRGLDNVHLLGRHPLSEMPGIFACADALLVSLKTNDVFEKTIPGKVQAYLASGRPLIGMINGEAARVIEESGAGFACKSGDSAALAALVTDMAKMDVEQRRKMGTAGRAYYEQHYAKSILMERLETMFRTATLRHGDK